MCDNRVRQQPTNFKAIIVAAIKKYLQERGVIVDGYLKSETHWNIEQPSYTAAPMPPPPCVLMPVD